MPRKSLSPALLAAIFAIMLSGGALLFAAPETPKKPDTPAPPAKKPDTPAPAKKPDTPTPKKPEPPAPVPLVSSSADIKAGDDAINFDLRLGAPQPGKMEIEFENGKKIEVGIGTGDEKNGNRIITDAILKLSFKSNAPPEVKDGKTIPAKNTNIDYWIRPRLNRYEDGQMNERIFKDKKWEKMPSASGKTINFDLRQDKDKLLVSLDGRYCARVSTEGKLKKISFSLPGGGISNVKSYKQPDESRYVTLDSRFISRSPGAMKDAKVSFKPGLQKINDVPILVAQPSENIDVAEFKRMKGSYSLECDDYLSRTALDGMPESLHISLPIAFYTRAWVLCAAEPKIGDPLPDKEPVMTVRLTRFAGGSNQGRGGAISDTMIKLPQGDEKIEPILHESCNRCLQCIDVGFKRTPSFLSKVGELSYKVGDKDITVPLYLAEVRLDPGMILDLLNWPDDPHTAMKVDGGYLDFEFVNRIRGFAWSAGDSHHKPWGPPSSVHIFGVTLEKSPVELNLAQPQPGLVFHNDEKPETIAEMKSIAPFKGTLSWKIFDSANKIVKEDSRELDFSAAGQDKKLNVPFEIKEPGWYGVDLKIADKSGRELLIHKAAFAQMGKDTRKAGYDSPYGIWWFGAAHIGFDDPKIVGPLLFKAGFRKIPLTTKYTEKDYEPWKITLNQISSKVPGDIISDDEAKKKAAYDELEKHIQKALTQFPSCTAANIYHESFSDNIPAELLNEKPKQDDDAIKYCKNRADRANAVAAYYREKYPQVKMLVGNTSCSAEAIAILLRGGMKPEYIDYIGIETPAQSISPEKPCKHGMQSIWFARETARKFGLNLKTSGCWEMCYRVERLIGAQRQAEWQARDILLMKAYEFPNISPGLLCDVGNSYYNTLWGGSGICQRYPLLYPKPAYVSMGTVTKALDQTTLSKQLDTGSSSVHALEFKRADGKFAYPVWTSCGKIQVEFNFPQDAKATLMGTYGKEEEVAIQGGKILVASSTAPVYLISPVAAKSAKLVKREFDPVTANLVLADKMDKLDSWLLFKRCPLSWRDLEAYPPIVKSGNFELRQVKDEEKGDCLELELKKDTPLENDLVGESAYIQLKKPVQIPGKCSDVALWIKGDSGWGKVIFELQDATGASFRTESTYHDWPGDLAINFDGWRLLSYPIDGSSILRPYESPGPRWVNNSYIKWASIKFPIKISGLYVILNRKSIRLTEFQDMPAKIRLAGIGAVQEAEQKNK